MPSAIVAGVCMVGMGDLTLSPCKNTRMLAAFRYTERSILWLHQVGLFNVVAEVSTRLDGMVPAPTKPHTSKSHVPSRRKLRLFALERKRKRQQATTTFGRPRNVGTITAIGSITCVAAT